MLFSEEFNIKLTGDETWFDPIINFDTPLYIDPFLIFQDEFGYFIGAHEEIINFYSAAFELIAKANNAMNSPQWKKAVAILETPEVQEICLGVTTEGTDGAGASKGKARKIALALNKAVNIGISNPQHFETVQLFEKGIAEDTVSDAVANIIR